ncbi:uncharacterized protein BCR38DRAFT_482269 [Pseudomassariella vexata]|uniref:Uncharacterized protein n=1 Tax=Pseudomassariella vexata TaxID=1141098 RepID=A0A1Y2EBU9_9PEZI|nr:uncharacterized protein BCR38DRAFT_482269 [Pseudomassariella vexata]ORY68784.1 hypothetical protein BCR38DRAFT_482269 [Pseudomassariella vexata]
MNRLLKGWFPTISHPLVISAPMLATSNGTLAAEVSKAGGLGTIPGGSIFTSDSANLQTLDQELLTARKILNLNDKLETPLPVGIGFLTFHHSTTTHFPSTIPPLLIKHKPLVIWLFAPDPSSRPHQQLIPLLHKTGKFWGLKVFVQVGSVAAAREAMQDGADGIIAQGIDAGGHQWAQGAGVVSLVPEVREMLRQEFDGKEVALFAAGGIVDGSGLLAMLVLGADGVVMGTRFIAADESSAPGHAREVILGAEDGGISTVKSHLHDSVKGVTHWPKFYDGRAIAGPSIRDEQAGLPLEENIAKYKETEAAGDNSRNVYWSGTAVGLVKNVMPAGRIVEQVRNQAIERMAELKASL